MVGSVGGELRRVDERGRRLHLDRELGEDIDAPDEALPAHPRFEGPFLGQAGTQGPVEGPALVETGLAGRRDGDGGGNGPIECPAKVDEVGDADRPLATFPSQAGREFPAEHGVLSDGDDRFPGIRGRGLALGHGHPRPNGYTTPRPP